MQVKIINTQISQTEKKPSFGLKIDPELGHTLAQYADESRRTKRLNKRILKLNQFISDDFTLYAADHSAPSAAFGGKFLVNTLNLCLRKTDGSISTTVRKVIKNSEFNEISETYHLFMNTAIKELQEKATWLENVFR